MASFVLELVWKGNLVFKSIQGYVWGVVDHHLEHHYASPLSNVRDWAVFMHSVEVETHIPSEPRKMVGWSTFIHTLHKIDRTSPWEVGIGLFMLVLFYCASRPEILPGTLDGQRNFDKQKHFRRRDIRYQDGHWQLCFREIKQDRLCKRKHCVRGEAWRPIGKCTGIMDFGFWATLYFQLVTFESEEAPLWIDDRSNLLTYPKATSLFRLLIRRVADLPATCLDLGLGGIRSLSFSAMSALSDTPTARWIGMWASDAFTNYDRAMYQRTLDLAPRLAQQASECMQIGQLQALEQAPFLQQLGSDGAPLPDGPVEYEVQSIVDFSESTGRYKVRWKGFSSRDDTWEPPDNLRHLALFDAFVASRAPLATAARPPEASASSSSSATPGASANSTRTASSRQSSAGTWHYTTDTGCTTVGCTYGYKHSGVCSTLLPQKRRR